MAQALFPSATPPEAAKPAQSPKGRFYPLPQAKKERSGSLLVNPPYLDSSLVGKTLCNDPLVSLYKSGAVIHWRFAAAAASAGRVGSNRGQIGDMSHKSRLRAAFAFGNAPANWEWMITLTRRNQPKNPKADFDKFTRAMRRDWDCNCQWGWIMEYQRRHVVHHHIFLSSDFVDRNFCRAALRHRTVTRRCQPTTIVVGAFDNWVVDEWCRATGDTSQAFRNFQQGGIVEVFRLPDAAARYIAKEAGKRCQKALPKGVNGGRRWWWLSPAGRPKSIGTARLHFYPFNMIVSRIFDKTALAPYMTEEKAKFAEPAKFWVDTEMLF